ncbi:MAG: hypothetical protein LBU87_02255 [Lactobacillales bacterium]|jgi:uncharacterized lipoprotein|nr:hypothetical protein [Lactobacillales bacterium]
MKKIMALIFVLCLASCASYDNVYKLDTEYLKRRQLETRSFDTRDEKKILIASTQVLQDLGFSITESETTLGLITAAKDTELGSTGAKVGYIILAALAGTSTNYDDKQKVYVTLVTSKPTAGKVYVRAEFARIVWNSQGQSRIERITDENTYKSFFDKLSQSIFLTANDI